MRAAETALFTLAIAAFATVAHADNGKGHGKNKPHKSPSAHAASPFTANCPPGLAKKNPPCIPPGQAKKHRYRIGDRIDDDYIILYNPGRYDLDPYQTYYRAGDYLYRVDRDTREVLDFIGAAAALLD